MAKLNHATLTAVGEKSGTEMIVEGEISWDGKDRDIYSLELHVHFWGQDDLIRGKDDDLTANRFLISRSQNESKQAKDYHIQYKSEGEITSFKVMIRNTYDGEGRRFDEDKGGKDEVYAKVFLKEMGRDVFHGKEIRTNTVTGTF